MDFSSMNFGILALFGGQEVLVIGIVVVVLFGARKVPELMKGFGEGIREFKKASRDDSDPK
jgi:sec-independent protein translocase protein TatA